MEATTRLSVLGLGYVGTVSAGCFAQLGHSVVGVDIEPLKVELLGAGKAPLLEPNLEGLLAEQHAAGRLRATSDVDAAVCESEISLVCVGTPSAPNGGLELTYLTRVCRQIGSALTKKHASQAPRHVVVIRSTVLPGGIQGTIIPALESSSGLTAGREFGLALNPEFLREGSAIADFFHPPKTVIGASDEATGRAVAALYKGIDAPLFMTTIGAASLVKYADNAFHATKITFANEIGQLCRKLGVDSHEVMRIFCEDRKLNISPAYLKPGFAFGGSCLPKDLRAILQQARQLDLDLPLLAHLLPSNRLQVDQLIDDLTAFRRDGIGLLGLSFKPGTDDLRESPMVKVVEGLLGRGAKVLIYDPLVNLNRLVGSNLRYIQTEIPHIAELLHESPDEVVRTCRALVVAHKTAAVEAAVRQADAQQTVFDLARLEDPAALRARYIGICW